MREDDEATDTKSDVIRSSADKKKDRGFRNLDVDYDENKLTIFERVRHGYRGLGLT
jgi:hypothetical protein